MNYTLFLFLGVLFNVLAQFSLKSGANRLDLAAIKADLFHGIINATRNPFLIVAVLSYGTSFVIYCVALSKLELGKAYAMSSIATICLVFLVSVLFMNEVISATKIIGILLGLASISLLLR